MTALSPANDSANDDLQEREPLDAIFNPRSVAVVGATEKEGSVGRTILWNLLSSPFGGTVYPVNPTRPAILGVKAYPSLSAIGEPVDLAVIVTPAKTAPGLVEECGQAGIKGVIIISAGFKEIGPEGVELERLVLEGVRAPRHPADRPELPRHHEPDRPDERHLRRRHLQARPRRLHLPVGRAPDRDPGLGGARERRLQLHREPRLDAGRGLGRRHRLHGRTTPTRTPSSSTWRPSATRGRSCPRPARWPCPSRSSSSSPAAPSRPRRPRPRTPARSPARTTSWTRPSAVPACCAWTRSASCSRSARSWPSSRGPRAGACRS